jgi:hypothetical protein
MHAYSSSYLTGDKEEPMMNELSVSDGFKFGCGFFLAGFIAWIVMMIVAVLFSLVFSAALGSLFSDFFEWSGLLPLLALV